MAEAKLCVCPQCGKKYRLKAEFDAKSFACKACGATVWVGGKPAAPSTGRKSPSARRRKGAGRGRARGRAAAAAAPGDEAKEGGRSRYSGQQNSSTNVIIAVSGLVLVAGAILARREDIGGV